MKTSFTYRLLVGAAFAAFVSPAFAQSSDDNPSWITLDPITVDAEATDDAPTLSADEASVTRTGTPLIDVPQSIQVLTPTLLDEQELQTLTQAVRNVSGVVPNDPKETVLVNPLVRGLESEILVDGLLAYGDTAVIDPSSLIGVERVEVAKGPTSVLFGGGNGAPVGGLINLVTKTPKDTAFAETGVRLGSFETIAPWIDLNEPLGDNAGFRIAAEYSDGDDYIDKVSTERFTVHPSFEAALNDRTEFLLRGQYSRIDQLEYSGIPTEVARRSDVDVYQFTSAADAPLTSIENQMLTAQVSHQFTPDLEGTFKARYYKSRFEEFASFPFFNFFSLNGTETDIIRGQLPTEIEEQTVDASLLWQGDALGARHKVLAGAMWDKVDYSTSSGFDFTPIGTIDYTQGSNDLSFGAYPAITSTQGNEYSTKSLYAQDEISWGDRWTFLLSARYSQYKLKEEANSATSTDETYHELDPRVGVSFAVNDGLSVFAGYATGSRLSIFFNGADGTPPVPETSESYEAGVKFDMSPANVSGTVSVFEITRNDVPVGAGTSNPNASVQGGQQRSQGIEVDLVWEPTKNISVLANYAYIDARVTKESNNTQTTLGNNLGRVPDQSGRLAGRYRFTEGDYRGLGAGLGMTYSSDAPTTNTNEGFTDDYVIFDAQASYEWENYRVGLTVRNLTDQEYLLPYQYLNQDVVQPGAPLSAFVSLSARF